MTQTIETHKENKRCPERKKLLRRRKQIGDERTVKATPMGQGSLSEAAKFLSQNKREVSSTSKEEKCGKGRTEKRRMETKVLPPTR